MKKILVMLILCLLLIGCTFNEGQPSEDINKNDNNEVSNIVNKINESKNYVYVDKTYDYNFETIMMNKV